MIRRFLIWLYGGGKAVSIIAGQTAATRAAVRMGARW